MRLGSVPLVPIPVAGFRWLDPADAPALVELTRACYGETYSHRALYDPEQIRALWVSGELASAGELDAQGELCGHTAFWLRDPSGDGLESCLSFIHPAHRTRRRGDHRALWRFLLPQVGRAATWLHQATTTVHPVAQRYAEGRMGAVPSGLVIAYAVGERVVGFRSAESMHALCMSSLLRADRLPPRVCHLPQGSWGDWLASVFTGLPGARRLERVAVPESSERGELPLSILEQSSGLSLLRRLVDPTGCVSAGGSLPSGCRTDLVHLPAGDARSVGVAWPLLLAAGYLPVGVRPRATRPDEIVLQRVPEGPSAASRAVADARLARGRPRALFEGWSRACALAS